MEICDNGIDDDNDSLIDLNDDDCICELITPISRIPNPSFEEMECCPTTRSQLHCATNWIQASEPTTDYIHSCGYAGWDDFPPPQPFPDGEGIMGFRDGRVRNNTMEPEPFWKEYAGACLINPLRKDSVYRFQFDVGFVSAQKSPPIDITFFGTGNCDNLPFGTGDETFGCPSNDPSWTRLARVNVSGDNEWVNTFIEITPLEDIYAIAIGPNCEPISSNISIYYFFDNLLLADFESFAFQISAEEHPCSSDFTLSIPFNSSFQYQWYLNGIALVGEDFSTLQPIYGSGTYQVRILDGISCRVSQEFEYAIPEIVAPANIVICEGDSYQFGDLEITEAGSFLDTFQSVDNCDSIVALELGVIGLAFDTVEVSILAGETFEIEGSSFRQEGEYPLTLTSSLGCDSLVLLKLDHFNVFIPNAFSPNRDGINDLFFPSGPLGEILSYSMLIFDRWGNKIYEGTEWDGSDAQPGVFFYVINFAFSYGASILISGDVSLLK